MRLCFTFDQLVRINERVGRLYVEISRLNSNEASSQERYAEVHSKFYCDLEKIINNEPLEGDTKQ